MIDAFNDVLMSRWIASGQIFLSTWTKVGCDYVTTLIHLLNKGATIVYKQGKEEKNRSLFLEYGLKLLRRIFFKKSLFLDAAEQEKCCFLSILWYNSFFTKNHYVEVSKVKMHIWIQSTAICKGCKKGHVVLMPF